MLNAHITHLAIMMGRTEEDSRARVKDSQTLLSCGKTKNEKLVYFK